MPSLFQAVRDVALSQGGEGATYVPKSGTGAFACTAIVRPVPDEVAEFPELRGVLGAERPGWAIALSQDECMVRPVPGDRVTLDAVGTLQLRGVRSDAHGVWWLCTGFVVAAEVSTFGPSIYMPCGLGFATAGSLLA